MDNDNPVHPTLSQPLKLESEDGFILYTVAAGDLPNENYPAVILGKNRGIPMKQLLLRK